MNHQDEEITDVVIVLECKSTEEIDVVIVNLKTAGLTVDEIDYENAVVEGSIEADMVKKLQTVACVKHVRSVFSYTADFPPGDPRDKDGAKADEDGDDDADE